MQKKTLASILVMGLAGASMAQLSSFTSGRLIFTQLGDTEALANTGNTVRVIQINKYGTSQTGTNLGDLTNTAAGVVVSGTATSEINGFTSLDSRFFVLGGYRGPLPASASISGIAPSTLSRAVARLDFTGAGNYTTSRNTGSSNNFRSIATDRGYNIWAGIQTDGVVALTYGSSGQSGTALAAANNRVVTIAGNTVIVNTASGFTRFSGLQTTAAAGTAMTLSGTAPASVYGTVFIGDANGTIAMYTVQDSSLGLQKWVSTTGLTGTFTLASYSSTNGTNGFRSLCTDGKTLFASGYGNNGNAVFAIVDNGTIGATANTNTFTAQQLNTSVAATKFIRAVALAPEATVVDSEYSSAQGGNIMTLRQSDGAQRTLRVGLVTDSSYRSWTNWATVSYSGQAIKSAVDTSGNVYILTQNAVNVSGTITPQVIVYKVTSGGTVTTSTAQTIPVTHEAFDITVDSSNRPIVAYRPLSSPSEVRFVRFDATLATPTTFDNSGNGFTNANATVPTAIGTDGTYIRAMFASGSTLSFLPFDSSFSAGTASTGLAIAADGSANALNPIGFMVDASSNVRVLSVGATDTTRAAFRVDTLNSAGTSVTTQGTNYRRDSTAGGNAAAYHWALGISGAGSQPRVLLTGTTEPTSGPTGSGATDTIIGSGRVWTFNGSNAVTNASYRFAPLVGPVN